VLRVLYFAIWLFCRIVFHRCVIDVSTAEMCLSAEDEQLQSSKSRAAIQKQHPHEKEMIINMYK
jgi:hypothetical protein